MSATIRCPHCRKSIGGGAQEGGLRLRVGIVLMDPESGSISGPCPYCKESVKISDGATLHKAMTPQPIIPAFRIPKS